MLLYFLYFKIMLKQTLIVDSCLFGFIMPVLFMCADANLLLVCFH